MKKTMCIILLVLCSFCLSARDRHVTTSESGRLAEDLLEAGLYENRDTLLTIAPVLAPEELSLLYKKNKVNAVSDVLENGLLGFGLGSFTAGDTKAGFIQLGLEGGGVILSSVSLGYMIAYGFSGVLGAIFGQDTKDAGTIVGASAVGFFLGGGAFLAGRIYGIVRGIKYPKEYNRDLKATLYGTESAPQLSFAPAFSPSGIGFGVGVRF